MRKQTLEDLAQHDPDADVRLAAVRQLDGRESASVLARLARYDLDEDIRLAAIECIDRNAGADVLTHIAKYEKESQAVRLAAIQKL